MCKVKCEISPGLTRSERAVQIPIQGGGTEEVLLDNTLIDGDTVTVALVSRGRRASLVELPRETATGRWRVWIPNDRLVEDVKVGA